MATKYEIEMSDPSASHCECCGGLTVRLTRFVFRDGDAFAVYYARYSNNHPENLVDFLVSIGEWGEGSRPDQRASFFCRVRPANGSYEVMLGDAAESAWGEAEIIGQKLSREQALRHPLKATAFEVLDQAFETDRSLAGFLSRVECGDAAAPLEWSFQLPDDIFALGAEREKRAVLGRSFASLDDKRFFVRCLLPRPVEGYGTWSVGLWIEVSKRDYDQAKLVWDDPIRYPHLRFAGVVANDAKSTPELPDFPIVGGAPVQLRVTDPNEPPKIEAPAVGELADVFARSWGKTAFEEFAVARGFL